MTGPENENVEYRVAHLRERLAREEVAELGVQVATRGGAVLLTGTLPTAGCRDEILRIAGEELPGVPVRSDLVLAETTPPDHPEDLP